MNEQTQQPIPKPCPECGGQRVWVQFATSGGQVIKAGQSKRKVSLFGNKVNTSYLVGLTCIQCGFTTQYAAEPSNLVPDKE